MTNECEHPNERHTIWYWIDDGDPIPVPHAATFDNRADAVRQAESWVKEARPSLRWMKIFRADNEMYVCWLWENPTSGQEPEKVVVIQAKQNKKSTIWQRFMSRK